MRKGIRMIVVLAVALLNLPFLAQAQISFFQPPTFTGCSSLVADFNGDGKPDLLCYSGTLNLGNGDGTFTPGTPVAGYPQAVADFNGDGKVDILEQGSGTLAGTLLVLLGRGDGTFQTPITTLSGANFESVVTVDLNGDGKADVVGVVNSSLMVYLSNGDGTFKTGVSYTLPYGTLPAVFVGDFNGDGKTDVGVSNTTGIGGQEMIFLGNGDGTLQTAKTSVGILDQSYDVVGDFNGDGKLDLAIVGDDVYVQLGNGDGTFQAAVLAFLSLRGSSGVLLAAADVNGDGKLDLIFSDDPTIAQIYVGNGDGTFQNVFNYVVTFGELSAGMAIADFNYDGKLDVALGYGILLGNGDGTFQGIQLAVTPGQATSVGYQPGITAVGDFDKNGTIDVAGISSNSVFIFANDSNGKLSLTHTYTLPQTIYQIVTADFNGDGNLDLAASAKDPVSQNWGYSVLLGNGDGSFQAAVFYPQSAGGPGIVVADFNNDHKPDLAIAATTEPSVAILLGNGDGTFASPSYTYDAGGGVLLTADFNGDGKVDIAVSDATSADTPATVILFGNGDGTFQPVVFPSSLQNFAATFTADLNNDGKADLVASSQQRAALGNGDGTFTLSQLPSQAYVLGIADLNGDGKLDLYVWQEQAEYAEFQTTGIRMGNGDGTFGSLINVPTEGFLQGDSFADMNGDGRTDIVFWHVCNPVCYANMVSGVGVLINTTPPSFELAASVWSPSPVTAGNSASSTVTASPIFGFNNAVILSCAGLPSGANCTFNPPSVANSSGTSALTITTNASLAAGTYALQIQGSAGSIVNSVATSLVVQAPPDFTLAAASGSGTSQTISAGQTASFGLTLAPSGSFTGTVNLNCVITPTVTPAPTCTLSGSSVQISGSAAQTVTVTVATTAPVTASTVFYSDFRHSALPLSWTLALMGSCCLFLRKRRRVPALAAPVVVLFLLSWMSCGGGSSPSHNTTLGTPAGTYTATITATSGSLSHNIALQTVVQ